VALEAIGLVAPFGGNQHPRVFKNAWREAGSYPNARQASSPPHRRGETCIPRANHWARVSRV